MVDILIAFALFFAVLLVFSIPVGMFNTKMFKANNDAKASGLEFLKAHCPVFNVCYSRKLAYGGCPVFIGVLILCVILFLFRFVSLALLTIAPILVVFSPLAVIASALLYYILYVINAVDFARMLGCSFITILFCIFCGPVGYYMIAQKVLPYFKAEEDVISDRFGS